LGTAVNASAGSLLLRVPAAPCRGGEGRRGHAGCCRAKRVLLFSGAPQGRAPARIAPGSHSVAPEGARAMPLPAPRMLGRRMLCQVCFPARARGGGRGQTSKNQNKTKNLQLCQHIAPTPQTLRCCFTRVSPRLLAPTQPRHTLKPNRDGQGAKNPSGEAPLTSRCLFFYEEEFCWSWKGYASRPSLWGAWLLPSEELLLELLQLIGHTTKAKKTPRLSHSVTTTAFTTHQKSS